MSTCPLRLPGKGVYINQSITLYGPYGDIAPIAKVVLRSRGMQLSAAKRPGTDQNMAGGDSGKLGSAPRGRARPCQLAARAGREANPPR